MATSRYSRAPILDGGKQYGTSGVIATIRTAIKNGSIQYKTLFTHGFERLDTIAGREYGEGRYWWILAAASDVGWGLQVPSNTIIRVPDLHAILSLV